MTPGIADYDSENATNRPRSTHEKMKTEKKWRTGENRIPNVPCQDEASDNSRKSL